MSQNFKSKTINRRVPFRSVGEISKLRGRSSVRTGIASVCGITGMEGSEHPWVSLQTRVVGVGYVNSALTQSPELQIYRPERLPLQRHFTQQFRKISRT
jgi:hypothetical protein